jgi:hypothetical protein
MLLKFEMDIPNDKIHLLAAFIGQLSGSNTLPLLAGGFTPENVGSDVKCVVQPQSPIQTPTVNANTATSVSPIVSPTSAVAPTAIASAVRTLTMNTPQPNGAPPQSGEAILGHDDPNAEQKTLDDIRGIILQIEPVKRVSMLNEVLKHVGAEKLSQITPDKLNYVYNFFHKMFEV